MRIPEETSRPGEINIVPLIDIVFSIMVVFIVASLSLTRSQALDVELPDASTAQQKLDPAVTVSVTRSGEVAVNREVIPINQLTARVTQLLADRPPRERLVVINADLNLTHGRVVQVMDALQGIPNVSLAIAAQRPPQ
ncbi:MAG: biopolymer transporter ExbD [Thermostichales cyanobacterium SZTDM-1c_bins_54]